MPPSLTPALVPVKWGADVDDWSGSEKWSPASPTNVAAMTSAKETSGFTAAERAAMKERAAELRAEKGGRKKADGLDDLLAKIAEMPKGDREIAERIHAIVTEVAPQLDAKTWYGQPAWANADGKVVVFFQSAATFDTRYANLGFNDVAALDDGTMWPTSFAVTGLAEADVRKIRSLVRKAVG